MIAESSGSNDTQTPPSPPAPPVAGPVQQYALGQQDVLESILRNLGDGGYEDACRAVASWCALNKRHRTMCQESGDTPWIALMARIFGLNAPVLDATGGSQKNFYALCARAAAYRWAERRLQNNPEDANVPVFVIAEGQALDNLTDAVRYHLTQVQEVLYRFYVVDIEEKKDKVLHLEKMAELAEWLESDAYDDLFDLMAGEFVELFERLANIRRTQGEELERVRTLAITLFEHCLVLDELLSDFGKYADGDELFKEEENKLFELQEQGFETALVRALVAVHHTGDHRPTINTRDIKDFYYEFVKRHLYLTWYPEDENGGMMPGTDTLTQKAFDQMLAFSSLNTSAEYMSRRMTDEIQYKREWIGEDAWEW